MVTKDELGTFLVNSNSSRCSVDNRHDRDRVCVCVCGNPVSKDFECKVTLYLSTMQQSDQLIARRKQGAGSLLPANETSGRGGRSYGRIALYLQQVSLAQPCRSLDRYIYIYIFSALRSNDRVIASFSIFCSIRLSIFCIDRFRRLHSIINTTK